MVVNRLLKGGAKVSLTRPEAGSVPYVIATAKPDVWNKAVDGIDVHPDAQGSGAESAGHHAQCAARRDLPVV